MAQLVTPCLGSTLWLTALRMRQAPRARTLPRACWVAIPAAKCTLHEAGRTLQLGTRSVRSRAQRCSLGGGRVCRQGHWGCAGAQAHPCQKTPLCACSYLHAPAPSTGPLHQAEVAHRQMRATAQAPPAGPLGAASVSLLLERLGAGGMRQRAVPRTAARAKGSWSTCLSTAMPFRACGEKPPSPGARPKSLYHSRAWMVW